MQKNGEFFWRGKVFFSEVLAGESVGLEPVDDRYWRVYFGPVWLGVFDAWNRQILTKRQLRRHPDLMPNDPQNRPSATLQDDSAE